MTSHDLFSTIDARASAVRLDGPAPAGAQLERILSAALRAPDHGRISPWRFVILEGEKRSVLANALADLLKCKTPNATDAVLEAERAKAARAPLIVVVAAKVNLAHKVPEIEQVMAVAAGVQNMFLAASALGFGAMWKTGDAAYDTTVKQALGLDATDHIVAFLYLGTATMQGKPRDVSLEGMVRRL